MQTESQQTAQSMAAALTEEVATQAMKPLTITQRIRMIPAWTFWVTLLSVFVLGGIAMIMPEALEPGWLDDGTDPAHNRWVGIMSD